MNRSAVKVKSMNIDNPVSTLAIINNNLITISNDFYRTISITEIQRYFGDNEIMVQQPIRLYTSTISPSLFHLSPNDFRHIDLYTKVVDSVTIGNTIHLLIQQPKITVDILCYEDFDPAIIDKYNLYYKQIHITKKIK